MFNFAEILDHHRQRGPERLALTCGEQELTYRQLHERVAALAAALSEIGVARGDLVALAMNNRPEFVEALLAANWIGAAFLPLNTRLSPHEWQYILAHAGAVAIIAEEQYLDGIDTVAAPESLRHRISLSHAPRAGWARYESLLSSNEGAHPTIVDVGEHDLHRLIYTSGTTSRPKGVPITYRNVLWKTFGHLHELGITAADSNLVCGPLYHVGALDAPALDVLYAGGRLDIMQRFDPVVALDRIEQRQSTIVWLAPAMIGMILDQPDVLSRDTSSIRLVLFGGEKTPKTLIERLTSAFPTAWLSDAYGLTETVAADTFNDAAHALSKAGSVGRPVMHLQVRILGETGTDALAAGQLGEVALRGPQVFSGYWKDPAATAETFREDWFLTGDVGRLDEDGYLYIEDRKKDMIVSGGENISSSEVERVLYEHPDVREVAVTGRPHERWGEVPHAFVVLRPGAAVDTQALRLFCRDRLAGFKAPKEVTFVESLPRTSSGKVLKRQLREVSATMPSGDVK